MCGAAGHSTIRKKTCQQLKQIYICTTAVEMSEPCILLPDTTQPVWFELVSGHSKTCEKTRAWHGTLSMFPASMEQDYWRHKWQWQYSIWPKGLTSLTWPHLQTRGEGATPGHQQVTRNGTHSIKKKQWEAWNNRKNKPKPSQLHELPWYPQSSEMQDQFVMEHALQKKINCFGHWWTILWTFGVALSRNKEQSAVSIVRICHFQMCSSSS